MIRLPAIFSKGMVLTKEAKIWGWAEPKAQISLSFMGKQYQATANHEGRFEAILISEHYGGPHCLTVGDIVIQDVYIGHVWLCGGQSNMEQPISRTRPLLKDYVKENPNIRAFQPEKGMGFSGPNQDLAGSWKTATADFLEDIFAVPYFFAQELLTSYPAPIGLINIAVGGTPAEAWLPEEIVRTFPGMYERLEPYKQPDYISNVDKANTTRIDKWHSNLATHDKGLSEDWHHQDYDDSSWNESMLLDKANRPSYGAIWYRKDIFLPENITGPWALTLGQVVDSVKVFVNGEPVAAVDYQYPPCRGNIPEGLLKPGKNTIAIRGIGSSNKHHFTPGKTYELSSANTRINLLGPWKWRTGHEAPTTEPGIWHYHVPCCVYNYMLAPVLGYSLDGIIWYQGESNTGNPQGYKALFEAFVHHIREHFGNVPVIFTQLANYIAFGGTGENWAQLRDQQKQCLSIPNTAMAVAIDCGEWNDLHPQDKKTVGERLALCARGLAYGEEIAISGPMAKEATAQDGEITISFDHGEGLWAINGRPVVEIIDEAGATYHFYGEIVGETLTAKIGEVSPKIVRFGWMDCPTVVLYNAHGLPASPFMLPVEK